MKKKKIPTYKEDLYERLRNPEYAEGYLNGCLDDDDKRVFLLALKDVIEAQGGSISKVARMTKISREHIYRMLSDKGNPEFTTLQALLGAFNLRFSVSAKTPHKKAA